jgi:hypothetical protein
MVLGLAVLTMNCSRDIQTPIAPKWDVDLTVPITDRTLTLGEMIDRDTSLIHEGAGNQLFFSKSFTTPPTMVGDQISLTPSYGTAELQLGVFAVAMDPMSISVTVPGLPPGATVPIPPTSFALPDIPNALPQEAAVKCASGTIGLTLRNNLPVTIVGSAPVKLVDAEGALEAFFDFTNITIPPGGSHTIYDNLAGRTLGNGTGLSGLSFSTPGSSGLVKIPADSMLVARLAVTSLRVSEAQVSGIPAQRLVDNNKVSINIVDSTIVRDIRAKSGRLALEFQNRIDMGLVLKFRFTDLWRPVGGQMVQFEDSVALTAAGEASYEVNLAGCRIASPTGNLLTSLELTSSLIIPKDITTPVGLHDTDKVEVSMTALSPIIIDTAAVVLKPTWIDLDQSFALDLGDWAQKLKWQFMIPSASLVLNTNSSVVCPTDLYLTLSAKKNASGSLAVLRVPASQRRLNGGQGIITFDEAEVGAFLSQFSGGLPDSIRISGKVLVNPSDVYLPGAAGVRTIGSNCSFDGAVSLSIPMKVGFSGSSYCDTIEIGGNGQHRTTNDTKGVNTGRIMLELDNALPMQVGVKLRLLDAMRQPMLTIPQSGVPVQINSPSVDGQGNVSLPAHSKVTIELNKAEVQLINPAYYVEYTLDFSTSAGSPAVNFRTTDYIHVRSWSEISYGVNK